MTLEFITPSGSYSDAISFSFNTPNIQGTLFEMTLFSRYTNKYLDTLSATLEETTDRYTTFTFDYTDELGDGDYSGFYDYRILVDSEVLETGLVKFINNKTKSVENQPKYTSPDTNDDAKSYVIY